MRRAVLVLLLTAWGVPSVAQDADAFHQQTLRNAVAGFAATCLATAPDFAGISEAAGRAGFTRQNGLTLLPGSEARLELRATQGGCACTMHLIAPDPNATVAAVSQAIADAGPQIIEHPEPGVAAQLMWPDGGNILEITGDLTGQVPMLRVTLWNPAACPQ